MPPHLFLRRLPYDRHKNWVVENPVFSSVHDTLSLILVFVWSWKGENNKFCEDHRSMTWVRQHIAKEREKVTKLFGPNKFTKLGFTNMGEQVAESLQMDCKSLSIFLLYLSATGMGHTRCISNCYRGLWLCHNFIWDLSSSQNQRYGK